MVIQARPDLVGEDDGGRRFFAVRVPSLTEWPESLPLSSPYFVCLVIADGTTETAEELSRWAQTALRQGLVYACAWGPGSDVVEDAVDWQFIAIPDHQERPIVVTASLANETLEDAVYFFMVTTLPADGYESECSAWLLVEVGKAGAESGARDLMAERLTR